MYAAYLDESFDGGNAGIYAVACVFGDGWDFLKAERLWSALLVKHRLKVFKSKNLARKPKVVLEFAQAIVDSGLVACGIVGRQPEVLGAIKDTALHSRYRRSPYMLLYHQMFVNIAMDMRECHMNGSVSFVCDDNSVYRDLIPSAYRELCSLNKLSEPHLGSLSLESDDCCIPLQMADLIAGEIRRRGFEFDREEEFSPALGLLLSSRTIWSLKHMNKRSLQFVKELVDKRAPPYPRRQSVSS